jgi:hypothetical protein
VYSVSSDEVDDTAALIDAGKFVLPARPMHGWQNTADELRDLFPVAAPPPTTRQFEEDFSDPQPR